MKARSEATLTLEEVHASLNLLKGLLPDLFATCTATVTAFCEHLTVVQVLLGLLQIAAVFLHRLPIRTPENTGGWG